jgi:hypothetical protein
LRTLLERWSVESEVRSNPYLETTAQALLEMDVQAFTLGERERSFSELVDQLFWMDVDDPHGETSS